MDMGDFHAKIKNLSEYSRTIIFDKEARDDFVQFCAVKIIDTRSISKCNKFFYVDFVRDKFGRHSTKKKEFILLREEHQLSEHPENSIIDNLDNKKIVKYLLSTLPISDRLIIQFIYFDDLSHRDVADIFQVTEAAISMRKKTILEILKKRIKSFVAHQK